MKGCSKVLFYSFTYWGNLDDLDEVLHQTADTAMRMELCRAEFSADTLQHFQLWESKIQCFDPKSFEILGRLAISFTGLWIKPWEMCTALLKGFCTNCVHANQHRGLFLPVCFGFGSCIPLRKNIAGFESCNRNEKHSFPASLIFPKPLWCFPQKSKVSRVSIFGFLAADKLRMCFGHFSWVITKQQCQPLLSIWKVSCFQPSPPWNNWGGKKTWLAGGMNAGNDSSGKGIIYTNPVALWVTLFWQPGQWIAGPWQLTWGYGLERAPPRLLCACPPHFMPDSTMAGNFKLPFFTIGP